MQNIKYPKLDKNNGSIMVSDSGETISLDTRIDIDTKVYLNIVKK